MYAGYWYYSTVLTRGGHRYWEVYSGPDLKTLRTGFESFRAPNPPAYLGTASELFDAVIRYPLPLTVSPLAGQSASGLKVLSPLPDHLRYPLLSSVR